jgi:Matrixin
MTDTSFLCLDAPMPLELQTLADEQAVAIRADNDGSNLHAAGEHRRFWGTGMILRVRFLDGPELASRVMDAAESWTDHAHLYFQVVSEGDAEIRVTFEGNGNSSALGTDATLTDRYPPGAPTMCLAEIPVAESSARVDRIARHEFGHAIGLVHEHSSPAAGIRWDKAAVYAALTSPPHCWTREMVEQNVFRKYEYETTNSTAFDPKSIMLYPVPPEWTQDRVAFPHNTSLSETDMEFVRRIYPGRV